jgi:hypothetical protein
MSVTIFGILNIGFALFGFGSLLLSHILRHAKLPGNSLVETMQSDPSYVAWTHIATIFGLAGGLALLTAGIGLLLMQNWARVLSIIYSVIQIIYVLVGAVFNYHFIVALSGQMRGVPPGLMAVVTLLGFVIGVVFSLAYPVLLLIFMAWPKVIAAFGPEPPVGSGTESGIGN